MRWCRDERWHGEEGPDLTILSPDLFYVSVDAVDLDELSQRGVRALLVDLDGTLVPRDQKCVPQTAIAWSARIREAGFVACLVSNNWHDRVSKFAQALGFVAVPRALKPLPFAFMRACRLLSVAPRFVAVVGDQVFTDTLGANLIGATSVLVKPLGGSELPHTVLLRRLEAAIMAGREPLGGVPNQERKEPTA